MTNFEYEMSDEEKIAFADATMFQANQLCQYMLGVRHEPDDPITVMKRHIQFFQGDWIGLIDFDLDMYRWSTKCFYNANTESTTDTLIEECEGTEKVKRWVQAINDGTPIIIEDIEDIKDEAPEEYEMYKRFNVQSVLGLPYMNCGTGLLVVRNPKRFNRNYQALAVMSYIITSEISLKQRRIETEMKLCGDEPSSESEVNIKMLGEMEIVSKNLRMKKCDITDPMRFVISYMAMNPGQGYSLDHLAEIYRCDTESMKNYIYRFRKKWKSIRNLDNDAYQLIVTVDKKDYMLNPDLKIQLDIDSMMALSDIIDDAKDFKKKKELLTRFISMYRGEFLKNEATECSFVMNLRFKYKGLFIDKMAMLLDMLFKQGDYVGVIDYAETLLAKCPHSVDFHAYRIRALFKQGKFDLLKGAVDAAIGALDGKELSILNSTVCTALKEDNPAIENFDDYIDFT